MKTEKQLRELMASASDKAKAITDLATSENRDLTVDEVTAHQAAFAEFNAAHDQLRTLIASGGMARGLSGSVPSLAAPSPKAQEKAAADVLSENVAKIFATIASKDLDAGEKKARIGDAQRALRDAGHYRAAAGGTDFNTLIDTDGGVFLPEAISDQVFDIARQYGVFARYSQRFPTGGGRIKIPNVLGELAFQAVNQRSEILVDSLTFQALNLDDLKWALFVPWTNEMDYVRGAQIVGIVIQKLGQAFAKLFDNIGINGNGTSTYHNIKGLVTLAADTTCAYVAKVDATSGRTSFAAIDGDDWLNAQLDIAPGARTGMRYVAHPDRKINLINKLTAATAANPVKWITMVGDQMFIHGVPIDFTEAFPNTDGTAKPYAALVNFGHVAIADRGSFTAELFETGSIKTTAGDTLNLLSQDMKALRVKAFADLGFSPVTVTDEANVTLGSFAVLYTA